MYKSVCSVCAEDVYNLKLQCFEERRGVERRERVWTPVSCQRISSLLPGSYFTETVLFKRYIGRYIYVLINKIRTIRHVLILCWPLSANPASLLIGHGMHLFRVANIKKKKRLDDCIRCKQMSCMSQIINFTPHVRNAR